MAKRSKVMKLSEIGTILFECKEELKVLGDALEDNGGNKQHLKHVDALYVRVSQARESIENKTVVID